MLTLTPKPRVAEARVALGRHIAHVSLQNVMDYLQVGISIYFYFYFHYYFWLFVALSPSDGCHGPGLVG